MKNRIIEAIRASDPERRGWAINQALAGCTFSFSDLMTDLEPFIAAEVKRAVEAERAKVAAEIAELRRLYGGSGSDYTARLRG